MIDIPRDTVPTIETLRCRLLYFDTTKSGSNQAFITCWAGHRGKQKLLVAFISKHQISIERDLREHRWQLEAVRALRPPPA